MCWLLSILSFSQPDTGTSFISIPRVHWNSFLAAVIGQRPDCEEEIILEQPQPQPPIEPAVVPPPTTVSPPLAAAALDAAAALATVADDEFGAEVGQTTLLAPQTNIRASRVICRNAIGGGYGSSFSSSSSAYPPLPTVSFQFEGRVFALTPEQYVLPNGQLAFQAHESDLPDLDIFILGDVFLRNVYTIFDADRRRVGFALPRAMPVPIPGHVLVIAAMLGLLSLCFVVHCCRQWARKQASRADAAAAASGGGEYEPIRDVDHQALVPEDGAAAVAQL
jgi:hypothetical protein